MKNVFDITAFGAVGDGVTDCTAAIQEALDAAAVAGGVVEVPPGIYATGQLQMKGDRLTLHGFAGWGYRTNGVSTLLLNDPTAECLLDITGACGCTIEGVAFEGKRLGKNIHGVRLDWDKHYRKARDREDTPILSHCQVARFSGDGLHYNNVWAYKVEHCMLCHNHGAGLYYEGCDAFVSDTIFIRNARGGIDGSGSWASGATFTSNRIEWNGRGGILLRSSTSLNITGNYLDRNFGPAIDLGGDGDGGFANVSITGNVLIRNGAISDEWTMAQEDPDLCCHVRMRQCRNVVMSGNTMNAGGNDYGDGEYTPKRAFLIENCQTCIIKDNAMDQGYMETDIEQRGDCSTCLIKDNICFPA